MDIEQVIKQMTLEEKVSYCIGADSWHTKAIERLKVPSVKMSDGPHGLRCQLNKSDMLGINDSVPATCFPTAVTSGATWNRELIAREGEAIAREALSNGVSMVLGPGCNIKRDPLCGRNFEYFSEDPYIAGEMAAAWINGAQSTGAGTSLKHFAANSQEYKRMNGDSIMDERTLREIYLSAFETAVKKSQPTTVMCAYNKLNGEHCSDSKTLLTDILRTEWGFNGAVITDWGAMNDKIKAFEAGCDLDMPGGHKYMADDVIRAVKRGELDETLIDASVRRILMLADRLSKAPSSAVYDVKRHDELACEIARQGAVLLKNEGNILPADTADMVIIGHMAKEYRYQGAGSSHINPTMLTSLTDALTDVRFIDCGDSNGNIGAADMNRAMYAARCAKIAVVAVGLPDRYESEGFDRESMKMPQDQVRLIETVSKANANTVVVLLGGSPMETPWIDSVKAVLYMGLSGQAGGRACADILTGKVNPSGKLTESWPMRYDDVVCAPYYGMRNAEYREGIYVGYRYYDKAGMPVRFPFGHGLSYTSFEYSDISVNGNTVSVKITNTGSAAGAEVVQLYIEAPQNGIHRPVKELRGFERVELRPGESKSAAFELNDRAFAVWLDSWVVPRGDYRILIGASSEDVRLTADIHREGALIKPSDTDTWYYAPCGRPPRSDWEKLIGHSAVPAAEPQKGSYTLDNTCAEMKESSVAIRMMYKATEAVVASSFGGKRDMNDPAYRMMLNCAVDCPIRAMVINTNGMITDKLARLLVKLANK